MPCSCGNTTCPCGIPCYCSEELCKCQDCAIALDRICKVCKKPLITDIQTDKNTCSCFLRESTAFILENQDNPQCRMGDIPIPVGYFAYGKLIVNMIIPVPVNSPQFGPQQPISLTLPPQSIQTDFENIFPSFISDSVLTPLSPRKDSGISSPELNQLLDKFSRQPRHQASSDICSTSAQNREVSGQETCPTLISQSLDKKEAANMIQNTETGRPKIVQESSFYLPSIKIGNTSYPVGLEDPVWRLPNLAFSNADNPESSLTINNPFYVAGQGPTTQAMTTFDKRCHQPDPNLNFVSNGLEDSVTTLQINEQPRSDLAKITQPDLEIHGKCVQFERSFGIATENEFTFPLHGNSNPIISKEQWKMPYINPFPLNEIPESFLTNDKKLTAVSTDISASGVRELSGVQSQPISAISTSASGMNGFLQTRPVGCSVPFSTCEDWLENVYSPRQIYSKTQLTPENVGAPKSKLQPIYSKNCTQSSKENENQQSGNSRSASVNDEKKEGNVSTPLDRDTSTTRRMGKFLANSSSSALVNDRIREGCHSMQLYIDTSTTRKMETLLKAVNY